MYTHELADALRKLASILKSGPDVELGDLSGLIGMYAHSGAPRKSRQAAGTPMPFNALLSLSGIDKREWINLIIDLKLPIEIRSRDAARDIMGKVVRYLEEHPDSRKLLESRVQSKDDRASPELARALSSLLSK